MYKLYVLMILIGMFLVQLMFMDLTFADEPVKDCKPQVVEVCPKDMICMTRGALKDMLAQVSDQSFEAGEKRVVYHQNDKKVTVTKVIESRVYQSRKQKLNRLSLLGGVGPDRNLDTSISISGASVELENTGLVGLQYQRLVYKNISVGAMGISNGSGLLSIGIDF